MTQIALTSAKISSLAADALVVGLALTADGVQAVVPTGTPPAAAKALQQAADALRLKGKAGEVHLLPAPTGLPGDVVATTGLGSALEGTDAERDEALRRAAGAALRALGRFEKVTLMLPAATPTEVEAVALGALLGAYAFGRYQGEAARVTQSLAIATPLVKDKAAKAALARAEAIAAGVGAVRDLVNTPPSDLYPEAFAQIATSAAKRSGVKVTVRDETALRAEGFGGLIAVGQGSRRPPRLVRLEWAPARAKAHVALVGKGITFDSGGLSLKPPTAMETMKSDMAGAATVLHTVLAAAQLKVPVRVTGWLALAENMPSGSAQRPGDIITIKDGTTVEVLNTDAEGRLVLADGLVAARAENPDALLDIATLTGAQLVALGPRVAGVMGADAVRDEVLRAADAAGEQMWGMPLPAELGEGLKSTVADMKNVSDRMGGMLIAGIFLQHFAGDSPWAHLDVAGPAFNEREAFGYTPKGGTGMGLRTLLSFIEGRG